MAEPISIQQLKNASEDAISLGEAVNGDENSVVISRLGETYPTLSNALNQIDSKLDSADAQIKQGITNLFENGGLPATPFTTKALMTASALIDNQFAMVTDDTVNNGLYVKTAGTWVKSGYDPLTQAATYTDSSITTALRGDSVQRVGYSDLTAPLTPVTGAVENTIIYADPITKSGVISGMYARFFSTATTVTLKIFNLVGADFVEERQITIDVNLTNLKQALPKNITVRAGQYLGFVVKGGVPLWTRSSGFPSYYMASGNKTTIAKTATASEFDWQLYYEVSETLALSQSLSVANTARLDYLEYVSGASTSISTRGSITTPKAGGMSSARTHIPFAKSATEDCKLTRASFYLSIEDSVGFFVARLVSGTTYKIVGETSYRKYPVGLNQVDLTRISEALDVKAGDKIGYKMINRGIYSDEPPADANGAYHAITVVNGEFELGGVYSVSTPQIKITLEQPSGLKIRTLLQGEYDAIAVKDPNTLYAVL